MSATKMHINNSNKHSSPYVNQQGQEQHSRAFFGLDGFATSNMSDEQLTEPTGNLDYLKERQPQLPSNSSHQNERLKPRQRKQQHTSSTIPLNSNRRNDGENSRIIVQRQQQPIGAPISASSAPLGFLSFGISLAAMMIEHTQLLDQEDIQSYDTRVIIAFVMFFGGLLQFTAGMNEMKRNNLFNYTSFCFYGGLFMMIGTFRIITYIVTPLSSFFVKNGNEKQLIHISVTILRISYSLIGISILSFWIMTCRIHKTVCLLYCCLVVSCIFLIFGIENDNDDTTYGNQWSDRIGGYFGLIGAVVSIWLSFVETYNEIVGNGYEIIPIGRWSSNNGRNNRNDNDANNNKMSSRRRREQPRDHEQLENVSTASSEEICFAYNNNNGKSKNDSPDDNDNVMNDEQQDRKLFHDSNKNSNDSVFYSAHMGNAAHGKNVRNSNYNNNVFNNHDINDSDDDDLQSDEGDEEEGDYIEELHPTMPRRPSSGNSSSAVESIAVSLTSKPHNSYDL